MSSLLSLDIDHCAIRNFLICVAVQRDPHGKAGRAVVPNDPNTANGLAARPLPNGLETLFAQISVAHSDRFKLRHADNSNKQEGPPQPGRCDGPKVFRSKTAQTRLGGPAWAIISCTFWAKIEK
jgi:hypothetical protein